MVTVTDNYSEMKWKMLLEMVAKLKILETF